MDYVIVIAIWIIFVSGIYIISKEFSSKKQVDLFENKEFKKRLKMLVEEFTNVDEGSYEVLPVEQKNIEYEKSVPQTVPYIEELYEEKSKVLDTLPLKVTKTETILPEVTFKPVDYFDDNFGMFKTSL